MTSLGKSLGNQKLIEEDDDVEVEFILSLCWDSGNLSAVYYNLTTLELHVSLMPIGLGKFKIDLKCIHNICLITAYLVTGNERNN